MRSASRTANSATTSTDFSRLGGLLSCPDDGMPLVCTPSSIECRNCDRHFPISKDGVVELLPHKPTDIARTIERNKPYWEEYQREFHKPYQQDPSAIAWGAPEISDTRWLRKRLRQVSAARPLIVEPRISIEQILCDIAAGAGNYTFSYAPYFKAVLHCDLSVDNLNYAVRKARRIGIQNVFFLRIDYFSPPFQQSLDRIICFDTLIRGEQHEVLLLNSISRSLKARGHALVDFHNWWHNPLRRLGLLPQNFGENRSYRRVIAEHLLHMAGIPYFESFAFRQEFDSAGEKQTFLSFALPATRLLYRFNGRETSQAVERPNPGSKLEIAPCG
jgi:SAM-dependent methyltransferase